jgi:NAD(P)-dependent dehydrogenase (short-subunit alcohol dehydrogenase family)
MTADATAAASLFDLSGKTALVVGGSRGIGRAMSIGLARAGADVMIASRKLDSCQDVADEITRTTDRRAVPVACHIGRWADVDALAARAKAEFPRLDILVNNAGIAPPYSGVEAVDEAYFDKVVDVNLKGPFRLSALLGTWMVETGGGSIVFVSSVEAIRPTVDAIPYAAAKAGVNVVTEAMAHLFGPTVRVNCLQPGAFLTDISKHWDMDVVGPRFATYAARRAAQPEEMLGSLVYLASDASSFTTGAVIRVDGGHP